MLPKYENMGFNENQMLEIQLGLEKKLDVSIYAKPEYDWEQMQHIRFGLENGLDVSIYAKPEYDWAQMQEILSGLKNGVNVSIYEKPEYDWDQMQQIRLGLENGLDVSLYANPKLKWTEMYKVRLGLEKEKGEGQMFLTAKTDLLGNPKSLSSAQLRHILDQIDEYMKGKEYSIWEIRQEDIKDAHGRIDIEIMYENEENHLPRTQKLLILDGELVDGVTFHKRFHEWYS